MPTTARKKRSMGRNSGLFRRARARVLASNQICQFQGNEKWPPCGQLIDLDLKWPDEMSATVDHLVPVSTVDWNDPSLWDVSLMVPMHLVCNQRKGDGKQKPKKHVTSRDWTA
jgi:hypothetical protein